MIALVKIGYILQYMTTFALATNSPQNLSAVSWRKVEAKGRVTKHTSLFKVSTQKWHHFYSYSIIQIKSHEQAWSHRAVYSIAYLQERVRREWVSRNRSFSNIPVILMAKNNKVILNVTLVQMPEPRLTEQPLSGILPFSVPEGKERTQ